VLAAGLVPGGAAAGDATRARAVLAEATGYLLSLERFRFDATIVRDVVQPDGRKLQFSSRRVVTVRRPDRLYGTSVDDRGGAHYVYYDGEVLTRYDRNANVYGQLDVPDSLDGMLDYVEAVLGAPFPLADLLYTDLSHLGAAAAEADYVGPGFEAGVACHHLAFRDGGKDWQIWVERGERPLVRKLLITHREAPGQPQVGAYLASWDVDATAPDPLFRFRPPYRAERVRVLAFPPEGGSADVDTEEIGDRGEFR
jgi:hypothetical protein